MTRYKLVLTVLTVGLSLIAVSASAGESPVGPAATPVPTAPPVAATQAAPAAHYSLDSLQLSGGGECQTTCTQDLRGMGRMYSEQLVPELAARGVTTRAQLTDWMGRTTDPQNPIALARKAAFRALSRKENWQKAGETLAACVFNVFQSTNEFCYADPPTAAVFTSYVTTATAGKWELVPAIVQVVGEQEPRTYLMTRPLAR